MKLGKLKSQSGQALVPLLIFVVIGIVITSFTIVLVMANSANASRYAQGEQALGIAESGIENAMMRLLRDSNYSGETMEVGDGEAVITVTGNAPYIVTSTGSLNTITRTVQVTATRSAGLYEVTSWQEIP